MSPGRRKADDAALAAPAGDETGARASGDADGGPSGGPAAGEAAASPGRRPTTVATPWGKATLVEEVVLEQQADDRTFASLVQLVETADGEQLVRFAYTTDGVARRGPVTLRPQDLDRLRSELAERPALSEVLRFGGGA